MQMTIDEKEKRQYNIKDYVREIERLLDEERDRTTRILRRIDDSMDVLYRSQQILRRIS